MTLTITEKAQAMFNQLDPDGEGTIVLEDFMSRLSDFGHTDEEIETLFHRLDLDSDGLIDNEEFIRGYKLFAKSTGQGFNEEWRLWNQLDQREEEDKLKLSKLFSVLEKMQTVVKEASGALAEEPDETHAEVDVAIERDDHSLIVTAPLQAGIASDLLRSFMTGMPLSRSSAAVIISEATKVFKQEPNCCELAVPTEESPITIVGDLHGSLADLNCIFEAKGTPSATNRFIFNGDYVDRGNDGVEVMLVLLAYKVLHPAYVHLNRGNHEDILVNQSYGFQREMKSKYDSLLFGSMIALFKQLPLCCIVGGGRANDDLGLFVVHGGLFSDPDVDLAAINRIKREKYSSVIVQSRDPSPEDKMIEEMTWSDPTMDGSDGIYPSERGSGIEFGPDVTLAWLQSIGCHTLIRSHECMECGYDHLPIRQHYSLYTIFSASNYSDGSNQAATLTFKSLRTKPEIFQWRATKIPPNTKLVGKNRLRLADLVFRRHYRLLRAFQASDQEKRLKLPQKSFVKVLEHVLQVQIKWNALLPSLLGELDRRDGDDVDYQKFLARYSARGEAPMSQQAALSAMYDNFHLLKSTFEFWDEDSNGVVDFKEFKKGIDHINEQIEDETHMLDAQELFELVDLDRSGEIDMNEFCEAFRLTRDSVVVHNQE